MENFSGNPILQFGTSRFLQAHVDLFVSEALRSGEALGAITVVQSTDNLESARRIAAFNALAASGAGYPVHIRGSQDGVAIDVERSIDSVRLALQTSRDWLAIRREAAGPVQVIVSNTGDTGYLLDANDQPALLEAGCDVAPAAFPAKLLVLLHDRYLSGAAPVSLLPCELVSDNGKVLQALVLRLARGWQLDAAFIAYLEHGCLWINSLVDRIVSEPIQPVGAIAEPYALWAIEAQPNMVLPCRHPDIVVTENLLPYERRKLFILNLGHTYLVELWLNAQGPAEMTVLQALADPAMYDALCAVWQEEVLPVFAALGEESESRAYLAEVEQRFRNPFLVHRLADIARNHGEKKLRRFAPLLVLAKELGLDLPQARLAAALPVAAA